MPPMPTLPVTCASTGSEAAKRFATRMQMSFRLIVIPLADQEAAAVSGRIGAVNRVVAVHASPRDEARADAAVGRPGLGHRPALARAVERGRMPAGDVAVLA